ncbi:MAG: type II toxin-antitoxin system VapC family toxin [Desulfamplus sp.]|nr:type II toxin-antitoxin system VapC family toxin [Desulfamplus sp.]
MKPNLYLETTIPSYLKSKQTRDIIQTARQQITIEWWENRLIDFDIYISQIVVDEVSEGDPIASAKRLESIKEFTLLEITEEVIDLADKIMVEKIIPKKAIRDGVHIAVAAYHKMDFLLSWNCKHIANAEIIKRLKRVIGDAGYELPIICTPEELLERSESWKTN